jgi:hypothetical protein
MLACLGLFVGAVFADETPATKNLEFFEKQIRPVLVA